MDKFADKQLKDELKIRANNVKSLVVIANDFNIKVGELKKILQLNGILSKRGAEILTKEYKDKEYAITKSVIWHDTRRTKQLFWTELGVEFIKSLLSGLDD